MVLCILSYRKLQSLASLQVASLHDPQLYQIGGGSTLTLWLHSNNYGTVIKVIGYGFDDSWYCGLWISQNQGHLCHHSLWELIPP